MNYFKKSILFSMILVFIIANHGIGQVSTVHKKSDVKKIVTPKGMSIAKPLGKLQLSGIFHQHLFRGSGNTSISGGVVINQPGDTSNLGNIQISINNIKVPRLSPGSYSLSKTNTAGIMRNLFVKIVNKVSSNPPKFITWVTAKGTINPVRITSPPNGYIHTIKKITNISERKLAGIGVAWTQSSDKFRVILYKLVGRHSPTVKVWDPVVCSQFIPDSLLEPGQNYRLLVIQTGKFLTLKGNFTPLSTFPQGIKYFTYFSAR